MFQFHHNAGIAFLKFVICSKMYIKMRKKTILINLCNNGFVLTKEKQCIYTLKTLKEYNRSNLTSIHT